MGQGVNYVTGDYSRGASGFWVENGEIAFPVHEITIAGNLKTMLKGIEAVGADTYNYGAKTVGSLLVNRMKVAGADCARLAGKTKNKGSRDREPLFWRYVCYAAAATCRALASA